MIGITTALGRFDGVATDAAYEQHFIQVTGAFDALLGPQRGWTYLFALSPNHALARTLAMRAPRCADSRMASVPDPELAEMVPKLATSVARDRHAEAAGQRALWDHLRGGRARRTKSSPKSPSLPTRATPG